ncbi:hypothetical protein [Haloferula sp. A504]|uniref:hypothetical protein n=1 Tax=Haloferula sp. A504 TaxID=3373601 RepID=UPI0031C2578F|nr:hypothetical protein [Verrucomicrobiaceae bacterium E54]
MKFAGGFLVVATLVLSSCTDPARPPVPEAFEIEQTNRFEFEKRQDDKTWR